MVLVIMRSATAYLSMIPFLLAGHIINAPPSLVSASLADRSRVVKARKERSALIDNINSRVRGTAIEGARYRGNRLEAVKDQVQRRKIGEETKENRKREQQQRQQRQEQNYNGKGNLRRAGSANSDRLGDPYLLSQPDRMIMSGGTVGTLHEMDDIVDVGRSGNGSGHGYSARLSPEEEFERELNSQLTGCCMDYANYQAYQMCGFYGGNCEEGQEPSHDSSDGDCDQEGLSFIGVSFSVNTAQGNPYSYQLCDQFPTENLIDRDYEYVMSMDEDGWLVGGGYKSFDYSGKMPYIDSSHTELLRIGSIDPNYG